MKTKNLRLPIVGIIVFVCLMSLSSFGQVNFDVDGKAEINVNGEALHLDGSANYLSFYNGGTFKGYLYHDNTSMHLANLITTGNLDFWTSSANRMRIAGDGDVGIGTLNPLAKLHVVGDIARLTDPSNSSRSIELRTNGLGMDLTATGGHLYLNAAGGQDVRISGGSLLRANHGVRVNGNSDGLSWSFGVNGQSIFRGMLAAANTNSTNDAIRGIMEHTGNADRIGVLGRNTVAANYGYGVRGESGWYGVYGLAQVSGAGSRFGVYGRATNGTSSNYAIYGSGGSGGTSNYAGYFAGDVNVTGTFSNPSDILFKTNIETLNPILEKVNQLVVKKYKHKPEYITQLNMSDNEQVGFIAQELQTVFPDLVSNNVHAIEDSKDETIEYLGVNYIGLIPILTKGIQELSAENRELKDRLANLEAIVSNLSK